MLVPIATEITPFPYCFSSFFLVKGYKLKELRAVFLLLLCVHYCYPSDPCTSMFLLFPVFFPCYLLVLSFKGKHNFLYQSCRSLRLWYQVLILPSQALSLAPEALPNLPFIMCYPRNSLSCTMNCTHTPSVLVRVFTFLSLTYALASFLAL